MTQDQGAVDVKPVAMDTHFELHVVNKDLSCLPDSWLTVGGCFTLLHVLPSFTLKNKQNGSLYVIQLFLF